MTFVTSLFCIKAVVLVPLALLAPTDGHAELALALIQAAARIRDARLFTKSDPELHMEEGSFEPAQKTNKTQAPQELVSTFATTYAISDACSCRKGGDQIMDSDSCKAAAVNFGDTFIEDKVSWPNHARGCVRRPDGLYFNTHPTGACSDWATAVCSLRLRPFQPVSSATPSACPALPLPSQVGTIGDAAVQALEENNPDSRYYLWDDTRDASFDDLDFIVQMPVAAHWGMSEAQRVVARECDSGGDCDMEFNLVKCDDLSIGTMCPNNAGRCQILDSTKTSPSDGGKKLCIGDNDVLVDHFYNMIIKAQTHVDITSLDSPTGRFVPAIRNALIFLENEQRTVRVRMLFGNVITDNELARVIMERVLPNGCLQYVEVNVGTYRIGHASWNHGKIVAVDGEHLSYGGINLYPTDYLQNDNVYDITIHGSGTMAQTGHGYANALWNTVVSETSWGTSQTSLSQCLAGASQKTTYGTWDSHWPTPEGLQSFPPCSTSSSYGVRAIPAARLGEAYLQDGIANRNPSDHAFATMFAAAKSTVKISSQDFGPLAGYIGWNWIIIDALSIALVNGVDVYIVFSNPFGGPSDDGFGGYGYGWTATDVIQKFRERADDLCYDHDGSICKLSDEVLCQHLHVTYISAVSGRQTWENGHLVGNHGKFFAVDDEAFYVGSQNLYKCNLAEFGVIVDDAATTAAVIQRFWDPMWSQSVAISTSGSASSCCWRTASGLPGRNAWWASVPQPLVCDGEYVGPSVPYVPPPR